MFDGLYESVLFVLSLLGIVVFFLGVLKFHKKEEPKKVREMFNLFFVLAACAVLFALVGPWIGPPLLMLFAGLQTFAAIALVIAVGVGLPAFLLYKGAKKSARAVRYAYEQDGDEDSGS
jgi:phosphoglycerol transferase MdoB-like AlkP superfamily enzyme